MKCGSLSNHLVTIFRTLFRVIYAFLNLRDWMICWHIFNRYLVCFKNNDTKCTQCSSIDDNTDRCNFFIDSTSTCKWPFLWQMDGDSILVIIYDTQACTFGTVILFMNNSLPMRSYSNRLSLSSMLDESVFSSIMWLSPWCGKRSGIDISLMMRNRFFVNFQFIGNNVLAFLSGCFFLSLLLYIRYLGDLKPLLILGSAVIPYSGLHTLLNFLFPRRDFLLLPFFFDIDLCGPALLGFSIGCRTTMVRITLSRRLVFESTWLRAWWSGKLILAQLSYFDFVDKSSLFLTSSSKGKRDDFNFIFSFVNILVMLKRTKHLILSTRRRGFVITSLPSFNHQAIIWNVDRNRLVSWPVTLESVTSIVSYRFTVSYIVLWFITCTEILCESSCTAAWFAVILGLSDSRFRDPLRKNIQCWSTDSNYWCSQVCNVLLHCIVTIVRPNH